MAKYDIGITTTIWTKVKSSFDWVREKTKSKTDQNKEGIKKERIKCMGKTKTKIIINLVFFSCMW